LFVYSDTRVGHCPLTFTQEVFKDRLFEVAKS
jgi:hypothetical protein